MVRVTMLHVMLAIIGVLLVLLAALAIAMLRAMHAIRLCLHAMDSRMLTIDEMEELTTLPRPPNANPQARADEYASPLVRRAADKLTRRRIEAGNG